MNCTCCGSHMYVAGPDTREHACHNLACSARSRTYYVSTMLVEPNWWFASKYWLPFEYDGWVYAITGPSFKHTNGCIYSTLYELSDQCPGSQMQIDTPTYRALPVCEPDFTNAFLDLVHELTGMFSMTNGQISQRINRPKKPQPKPSGASFRHTIHSSQTFKPQPKQPQKKWAVPSSWPKETAFPKTINDAWMVFEVHTKRASHDTIKERYKLLQRAWHPDRHPNNKFERARAELHFKRAGAAYQILCKFHRWA